LNIHTFIIDDNFICSIASTPTAGYREKLARIGPDGHDQDIALKKFFQLPACGNATANIFSVIPYFLI